MWEAHNNEVWANKIENAAIEDQSIWQLTRSYTNNKLKMPPLRGINTIAYSDAEKAEEIAINLQDQFTPNKISDKSNDKIVRKIVRKFLKNKPTTTIDPCNPEEIIEAIKSTKKKKTPGEDGITNEMLTSPINWGG
ncbi:hypothetical protein HNY73_007818 [Argiope bruennichi]|uniref:Reverse transcriptase n=1 Tax=Argiope bruennichi TaxID=94029 RepID=A0A8T0FFU8_ARGBR|nr:hypothetical protein HNY73_007818 [Argiope bruennichi]